MILRIIAGQLLSYACKECRFYLKLGLSFILGIGCRMEAVQEALKGKE